MIPSARVIRAAIKLLKVTPVPVARALAAVGGNIAWAFQGSRRRTLAENLSRTASDRPERERRRLVRRTFQNMAVTAVDQFRLPSISSAELQALFEVRGLEHVDAALARGKGVVVATAHLGPYELAAAWLASKGYKAAGMVENLEPDLLEALSSYRAATGMAIVNMKDGLRGAYRVLAENYVLCLVADRAIGDARSALVVPFAGGSRAVPIGPAVFAQATGAALITAFASPHPTGARRYLVEFDAPLYAEGRDEAERHRLISRVVERMVAAIRRNPDTWFVFQPKWITREPA